MKKVYKGWIGRNIAIADVFHWCSDFDVNDLTMRPLILKKKGKQATWWTQAWPPLKVTITIEVEEK